MRTFNILIIGGALSLLAGCRALCPPGEVVVVHDTTTVETQVTYHDTVLVAPPAGATYTLTISDLVPGLKPILKANKNAKLTAQVLPGNRLVMGCYCDTVLIRARLKSTMIKEFRAKYKEVQKPPKEVPYTPGWKNFLAWVGGAWIAFRLILLIVKYFKP